LKCSKPVRISVSSRRATSRPHRSIHCERFRRPLAFWPWPPLRLEQPHDAWFASSTTARTPSAARLSAVEMPVEPEPMMATSASMSPATGPSSSGGSPAVATQ
jgi:hypothetical protein